MSNEAPTTWTPFADAVDVWMCARVLADVAGDLEREGDERKIANDRSEEIAIVREIEDRMDALRRALDGYWALDRVVSGEARSGTRAKV